MLKKILLLSLASTSTLFVSASVIQPVLVKRIVGGQPVSQKAEFMVLLSNAQTKCGGSLIEPGVIITSASCLEHNPKDLVIESSITSISTTETLQERKGVSYTYVSHKIHPGYDALKRENDIGILYVTVNENYLGTGGLPKPIARSKKFIKQKTFTALGFGLTSSTETKISPQLNAVELDVFPLAECAKTYGLQRLSSNIICAKASASFKDTCAGDQGGPLYATENGEALLIGITSWGHQSCNSDAGNQFPSAYTKLVSYARWIDRDILKFKAKTSAIRPLVSIKSAPTPTPASTPLV